MSDATFAFNPPPPSSSSPGQQSYYARYNHQRQQQHHHFVPSVEPTEAMLSHNHHLEYYQPQAQPVPFFASHSIEQHGQHPVHDDVATVAIGIGMDADIHRRRHSQVLSLQEEAEMMMRRNELLVQAAEAAGASHAYNGVETYYGVLDSRSSFASPATPPFPSPYSPLSLANNSRNTRPMTAPSSSSSSYFHHHPTMRYAPSASVSPYPIMPTSRPASTLASNTHLDEAERYKTYAARSSFQMGESGSSGSSHALVDHHAGLLQQDTRYHELENSSGLVLQQQLQHHPHSFASTSSDYINTIVPRPATADPSSAFLSRSVFDSQPVRDAALEEDQAHSMDEGEDDDDDDDVDVISAKSIATHSAKAKRVTENKNFNFVPIAGVITKRPRRRYEEIERLYTCDYPGCVKAYGTLNHLNSHKFMQKHGPKSSPIQFKELRKAWKDKKKAAAAAARIRVPTRAIATASPEVEDYSLDRASSPIDRRPVTASGDFYARPRLNKVAVATLSTYDSPMSVTAIGSASSSSSILLQNQLQSDQHSVFDSVPPLAVDTSVGSPFQYAPQSISPAHPPGSTTNWSYAAAEDDFSSYKPGSASIRPTTAPASARSYPNYYAPPLPSSTYSPVDQHFREQQEQLHQHQQQEQMLLHQQQQRQQQEHLHMQRQMRMPHPPTLIRSGLLDRRASLPGTMPVPLYSYVHHAPNGGDAFDTIQEEVHGSSSGGRIAEGGSDAWRR